MIFSDEHFGVASRWWRRLQPTRDGAPNPTADRAALARLRRSDHLTAMQDSVTFVLFRDLGATRPDDLPAIALCAGVLAAVRENRPEHPARTVGAPSLERIELARMKPLRFQRLISAEPIAERLTLLRRTVAIADAALNVRELAAACLDWSEDRRRRWIFEYYAAGRAVPASIVETVSNEEIGA